MSKSLGEMVRSLSPKDAGLLFVKNKYNIVALILIFIWCLPYFFTGDKLEWGDFSYFSQAYEAVRISILQYQEFPWWNPWVSGGVPLYANPQIGVFSPQTLLVLVFGAPLGLKFALAGFTFLGYFSIYILLRSYFKVGSGTATLLSLIWVFSSFFVAHLPSHFTFAWYMLAPFFVYLSLTVKSWKGGVILGGSFAIMALSQLHNPFVHISLVCSTILIVRLFFCENNRIRKELLFGYFAAFTTFIVLAGHRLLFTYQNLHEFPRNIIDIAPNTTAAILAFFLPYSQKYSIDLIRYPGHPTLPHGYNEATATIGSFAIVTVLITLIYLIYKIRISGRDRTINKLIVLYCLALAFGLIAIGSFADFSPYSMLKQLPVISDMRLSTRWYIWACLCLLVTIGLMGKLMPRKSYGFFLVHVLLVLAVAELFVLNVGYQNKIFIHSPKAPEMSTEDYDFDIVSYFGKSNTLPGAKLIPRDRYMPREYREYDATLYNQGVLYANDALVQIHLANKKSPKCGADKGCGLIQSDNAVVKKWSPNHIRLERTKPGNIELNINESSYMLVNGTRNTNIRVAEPFKRFIITDQETDIIDIVWQPSIKQSFKSVSQPKGSADYN